MAKKKRRKTAQSAVERDLIAGLEKLADDLESGRGYTVRTLTLNVAPGEYTAERVKETRALLNLSQPLFAQFLGVSPKAVMAWERGVQPSGTARRFMDEIRGDPDHWRQRLQEATRSMSLDTRANETV